MSASAEDRLNSGERANDPVSAQRAAEPEQGGAGNRDEAPVVDASVHQAMEEIEQVLAAEPADTAAYWRAEAQRAQEQALRANAELENVRKRAQREILAERKYAAVPLLGDLLLVADNIDRAIAAAEQAGQDAGLLEGIKMVADQLYATLDKHGCKRIDALGQPFDPHLHEAILQQPRQDYPPGTVAQVTLHGYQLHDRVVRPTQVIVAAQPEDDAPQAPAAGSDGV